MLHSLRWIIIIGTIALLITLSLILFHFELNEPPLSGGAYDMVKHSSSITQTMRSLNYRRNPPTKGEDPVAIKSVKNADSLLVVVPRTASYYRRKKYEEMHRNTSSSWRSGRITRLKRNSVVGLIGAFKDKRIFFYHSRKAGGSSVMLMIKLITRQYPYDVIVSEGLSLYRPFLDLPRSISIITLRDPIKRVMSLYWYEHLLWWYGPGNNTKLCRDFTVWLDAWKDKSSWKKSVLETDPTSTYVEVENYFVKTLIGWNASSPEGGSVGQKELDSAKTVLARFDIILICELLSDSSQQQHLLSLFPKLKSYANDTIFRTVNHKVIEQDLVARHNPYPVLAYEAIRAINKWDIALYEYGEELVALRLQTQYGMDKSTELNKKLPLFTASNTTRALLTPSMIANMGVRAPALHKGP